MLKSASKILEALSMLVPLVIVSIVILHFKDLLFSAFMKMNLGVASFLISFVASLSIVPIPSTYILFSLVALNKELSYRLVVVMALTGGLGASLGEAVAWIIGRASGKVLENTEYMEHISALIKLINMWGYWAIALLVFIFAFTMLPDKMIYLPLGMMGYSLWKILPITILGKILMLLVVLTAGKVMGNILEEHPMLSTEITFLIMALLLIAVILLLIMIDWSSIVLRIIERRSAKAK